jgi:Holliday junction resolvase RusA-like endonuclease
LSQVFNITFNGTALSINEATAYKVEKVAKPRFPHGDKRNYYVDSYPGKKTATFKRELTYVIRSELNRMAKDGIPWDVELTREGMWEVGVGFVMKTKASDSANLIHKYLIDTLVSAGLLADDNNVIYQPLYQMYDSENPRMQIVIKRNDKQDGIFFPSSKNCNYNSFVQMNCDNCKKNPDRCSAMTRYKAGFLNKSKCTKSMKLSSEGYVCPHKH